MIECKRCHTKKSEDQFSPDKRNKSGRTSHCKECNAEKYRAKWAERPELRERSKENHRKWVANNPERKRELGRNWYHKNIEEQREIRNARFKERYAADPEYKALVASWSHARKARLNEVETDGIPFVVEGKCYICETADADTIDHIVPINQGGPDTIDNKAGACFSCNSAKRDRVWPGHEEWDSFVERRTK